MSRRGWTLLLSLGVIWGLPYMFIKIAVETFSPATLVFLRVVIAAAVLLPLAAWKGQLGQLRGHWRWIIAFALVEMGVAWLAINWAEQRVTSSLTALLVATVPLAAAIIATMLGRDDRLTGRRVIGLAIGFAGIVILVGLDVAGSSLLAVGAMLIAVLGYAIGPIIADDKLSEVPRLAVIGAAMAVNAVIYAPVALLQWPSGPIDARAWGSALVLGLICSALAFVIFFALIAEAGATRATLVAYLNPIVAVILGVVVLSEPITLGLVIGSPLVLLGSWMATRHAPPIESEPSPV